MSNTSNVMALMEKYSATPAKKEAVVSAAKAKRIAVGNLFIQPTGGKAGKPLNYSYCYVGINGDEGFIAGFNMGTRNLLELVASGMISDKFADLFAKYAEAYGATETVMK